MTNNKQQTVVEWLFGYMFNPSHPHEEQFKLLEQAKEMEKEQIEQAELKGKEIIIIKHTEHGGGNK